MKTFKSIDRYGSETEFEICEPSLTEEAEGEMRYRIAFSAAIRMGILTRDKMREVLKENDILSQDDDDSLQASIREVAQLETQFTRAELQDDDEKRSKSATELFKSRNRMLQLFMVVNAAYTNSAEGYAELIKQETMMAACTLIKANGQRYWKDYGEYVLERDGETQSKVVETLQDVYGEIMNDKSKEMLESCPESKYLRSVSEKILDRAVKEAQDADQIVGERIDDTGIIRTEDDSSDECGEESPEEVVGKDVAEAPKVDEE